VWNSSCPPACEGQIAKLVEHDEVQTSEIIGKPSLATRSPFGLEPIDQVDSGKEPPRDPARIQLRAMAMAKCSCRAGARRPGRGCAAGR